MVVNTKEALQLEVGSVLGGPFQSNPPRSTPNPFNIDTRIHTHTAELPSLGPRAALPLTVIWLAINPGVIMLNEHYMIPSSTWPPSLTLPLSAPPPHPLPVTADILSLHYTPAMTPMVTQRDVTYGLYSLQPYALFCVLWINPCLLG